MLDTDRAEICSKYIKQFTIYKELNAWKHRWAFFYVSMFTHLQLLLDVITDADQGQPIFLLMGTILLLRTIF